MKYLPLILQAGAIIVTIATGAAVLNAQTNANAAAIKKLTDEQEGLDDRARGLELREAAETVRQRGIQKDLNDIQKTLDQTQSLLQSLVRQGSN